MRCFNLRLCCHRLAHAVLLGGLIRRVNYGSLLTGFGWPLDSQKNHLVIATAFGLVKVMVNQFF